MEENFQDIPGLLNNCEKNGLAPAYIVNPDSYKEQRTSIIRQGLPVRTPPVVIKANGEEIFVVSDLHIASGRNSAGIYNGTENFFADDSFYRFLQFAHKTRKTSKAILIINGDIFDFLRITDYPGKIKKPRPIRNLKRLMKLQPMKKPVVPSPQKIQDEYDVWTNELAKVGILKTRKELEECISSRERTYGLHTEDYKTIYRLIKINKGHPSFIKALSFWLENGNKLIVIKGNHDVELYWPAVRNYIRLIIAEGFDNKENSIFNNLKNVVLPNITFIDDSAEIDDVFYVEHGHRYDKFSMVLDSPALRNNPSQINIPFGSFINRYLLNSVEFFLPYLDNVKPAKNILPILIRENFPLAIKVLFQHIPLTLRIVATNFRYTWFMFHRVFWFFLALVLPVILLIWFNMNFFKNISDYLTKLTESSDILAAVLQQSHNFIFLALSYFLSRLVAWLQITEPSALDEYAEKRFEGSRYKFITMGHTHNPGEYLFKDNRRFYNTGTWIPIIEVSNAEVREDKTYTYFHLERDETGNLVAAANGLLQRWNDDAGRGEPQVLIQKK